MTRDPSENAPSLRGGVRVALIVVGLMVALSSFYVAPHLVNTGASQGGAGTATGGQAAEGGGAAAASGPAAQGASGGTGTSAGGAPRGASAGTAATAQHVDCAGGRNGGASDVGVDAHTIHLAATEVESGIGSSFLAPVRYGILAVVQKTNRTGGVCARQLQLTLKDDGWEASRGKQYLDNFIQSNQYLALAVVPSSEGLNAASGGGDLDSASDPVTGGTGIPVVGSDGMLNSQYTDPWIWPVAASTATSMRIMARDAHKRHARTFALVYNQSYKFGVEGAGAFRAQVQRDGGTLASSCVVPLQAGSSSYKDQVNSFNSACGLGSAHPVDFVALLLEPQTAETWLQNGPYMGLRSDGSGEGAGGPQPLFDDNFGNACGQICSNMQVWTSFYPPLFPYDQKPAVTTFKNDLCTVDSNCSVDADSAFTEGGYVGMQLLVSSLQALAQRNLAVTRETLRAQLDSTTLDVGLSGPLTFRGGNHGANLSMVAFRDTYGQQFSGFQVVSDQPLADPCPGCKDPSI